MPARPLTILQLTHQGGGSGSTVAIANLSRLLARRGHRVLIGCRPGTMLAELACDAGLQLVPLDFRRLGPPAAALGEVIARGGADVPNGLDCERVDAPPSDAELAAARAALGHPDGRPVVLVLARRKDQHILLQGLAALQRAVLVACVGIERDPELRAIEGRVPAQH